MIKTIIITLSIVSTSITVSLAAGKSMPIDRHAVVTRHNIELNDVGHRLAIGNGEFCFGADGTGLQTFTGNTMSHWAWHSFPLPDGWTKDKVPASGTFQEGRNKGGDDFPQGTEAIRTWMVDNPHKINLGRLRLRRGNGTELAAQDIVGLSRKLDLWSGVQVSTYQVDGQPVRVETFVHPELDMVAVTIESSLLEKGEIEVTLDFPYPTLAQEPWVGDFAGPNRPNHKMEFSRKGVRRADFRRTLDETIYNAGFEWSEGCELAVPGGSLPPKKLEIVKAEYGTDGKWADVTAKIASAVKGDRVFLRVDFSTMAADPAPGVAKRLKAVYMLDGTEVNTEVADNNDLSIQSSGHSNAYRLVSKGVKSVEFSLAFAAEPVKPELPGFAVAKDASVKRWESFWKSGGAIDLSASKDPRWKELERRIVLSQYQMAAQSAGDWPSAEIGLMALDRWHSQFHMEMVWWHLAHYALWDRWDMADKALGCYKRFAPKARELAEQLGYKGLKWQKSVGPECRTAPWHGNQVLLWKQPHPIFFAELEYRLKPTRATLDKWADIVQGTAEHMADYTTRDEKTGIYSLIPAMPPSEQGITKDTVFDLAYWRWALDKAQEWRTRLGLPREAKWDEVRSHLAPLPVVDGLFVHSAEWHDTYTTRAWEHPDPAGVVRCRRSGTCGTGTSAGAGIFRGWRWRPRERVSRRWRLMRC